MAVSIFSQTDSLIWGRGTTQANSRTLTMEGGAAGPVLAALGELGEGTRGEQGRPLLGKHTHRALPATGEKEHLC